MWKTSTAAYESLFYLFHSIYTWVWKNLVLWIIFCLILSKADETPFFKNCLYIILLCLIYLYIEWFPLYICLYIFLDFWYVTIECVSLHQYSICFVHCMHGRSIGPLPKSLMWHKLHGIYTGIYMQICILRIYIHCKCLTFDEETSESPRVNFYNELKKQPSAK
jgi:hypothetical protein